MYLCYSLGIVRSGAHFCLVLLCTNHPGDTSVLTLQFIILGLYGISSYKEDGFYIIVLVNGIISNAYFYRVQILLTVLYNVLTFVFAGCKKGSM